MSPCAFNTLVPAMVKVSARRFQMMKSTITAVLLVLVSSTPLLADDMQKPVNADAIKWGPAPSFFPAGAKIAVMAGDPSKSGIYVVRLDMPANYKIPAH